MATNKNTRPVINLDFDDIKSDIITFIKSNPAFSDYSFEGSALNAIVDILAYNTFNNAYYANMVHAEGFLDSAQKRTSVVSRAKELGYTPRSATCSTAFVSVAVTTSTAVYPPYALGRGDSFVGTNDSGSYVFNVVDTAVASINGNLHTFEGVKIVEGTRVKNSFIVDSTKNLRSIFTIPNKNVDISTLKLYVRDNISAIDKTEYFQISDIYSILPTSKSYYIQESYDGFFQIYFGSDVIGAQPLDGNVIDIDYYVCSSFSAPDGCTTFFFDGSFPTSIGQVTTTEQNSYGGAEKEGIDSIKFNAVKANSSKNRIVTVDDYSLELSKKFPFIKSASVWGGEINVPPVYGKVFISIQPNENYILSDTLKRDVIIPELKKTSMMTVTPEIVDPYYTMIEITSRVKFDQSKTVNSKALVESIVRNTVFSYMNSVSRFDTDYLEAELIGLVMSSDPGVISVDISKTFGLDISPPLNVPTKFSTLLNNSIVPGSLYSTTFNVILSTGQYDVSIKEIGTSDKLGLFDSTNVLVQEIGTINRTSGAIELTVNINDYMSTSRKVMIRCVPVLDDIIVKRNQILYVDTTRPNTNVVITENYGK